MGRLGPLLRQTFANEPFHLIRSLRGKASFLHRGVPIDERLLHPLERTGCAGRSAAGRYVMT